MAAFAWEELTLATGEGPIPLRAVEATGNLFAALDVQAARGRALRLADEQPGAERVAVLSDGLWRRAFGAEPDVVGSAVKLDDAGFTVVGVMPPGFGFPSRE